MRVSDRRAGKGAASLATPTGEKQPSAPQHGPPLDAHGRRMRERCVSGRRVDLRNFSRRISIIRHGLRAGMLRFGLGLRFGGGVLGGGAGARVEPGCGLGDRQVRFGEQARVRVGRDGDRGVAEHLLDVLQVGPGRVGRRCGTVAQVVEPDRRKTDLLAQLDEPPCGALAGWSISPLPRGTSCHCSGWSNASPPEPMQDGAPLQVRSLRLDRRTAPASVAPTFPLAVSASSRCAPAPGVTSVAGDAR